VQAIADACRGLSCLADLDTSRFDHTVRNAVAEMLAALRLVYLTPSETRDAGYLEFGHFGAELSNRRGRFDLRDVHDNAMTFAVTALIGLTCRPWAVTQPWPCETGCTSPFAVTCCHPVLPGL
jgi:hypothetical protein